MSAITAKASRKMKKYAVLTREPRCFLGSFDFSWEQRKVGDLLIERNQQAPMSDEYPLMAFIANEGVAPKGERYDRSALVTDTVNKLYKKTEKGDFIYSSNNLETGSIGLNKYGKACISPVYSIFEPTGIADSDFLGRRLVRKDFINAMVKWRQGVIYGQWRIHESDFLKIEIPVPSVEEQRKIGAYLDQLDNLITLHQRKCALLFSPFQALISMMFTTSTFSWEQRKFSELVQIERGGSPRPIDDFITDAPNGLNWIKIGDAPTQGNYITKTAEKIRPEGLSKTREVHPGDLILSNSMSFGKPYIMGIDGCIHDGWLLIRNTYGVFDLTFLCHLLGTPQMLSQYRSLAAGSTVNNLNKELVGNTVVTIPSITEQRVLGDYLEQLDNLITLHQRKCISFTGRAGRLISTVNKKRITSSWEQRKVGDLLIERNQQAPMSDEYPLMAFIANEGVAPKGERYDRSALVTDTVNKLYKKTEKGDFIYSSNNLETGSIGLNKYGKACISPVYSIFEPTGIADSDFLGRRLVRKDFINAMVKWRQGVIYGQWRIHESDFLKIEIPVPSVEEQRKIGAYLDQLDNLITLHQRKPFLMKWRNSDANRNQTNRLVL